MRGNAGRALSLSSSSLLLFLYRVHASSSAVAGFLSVVLQGEEPVAGASASEFALDGDAPSDSLMFCCSFAFSLSILAVGPGRCLSWICL
jgi:hypothetical protein